MHLANKKSHIEEGRDEVRNLVKSPCSEARGRCRAAEGGKLTGSVEPSASLPDHPRARHLRLSCPAKRKSFTSAGRGQPPYAAWSVRGVERVRTRRFCSINGSSTSPQLMHLKTVPSVE